MNTIGNFLFGSNVDTLVWCQFARDGDKYDWEKNLFEDLYETDNHVFDHKFAIKLSNNIVTGYLSVNEDEFNGDGTLQGYINMNIDTENFYEIKHNKDEFVHTIEEEIQVFMNELNENLAKVKITKIPDGGAASILYYEHKFYVEAGYSDSKETQLKLTKLMSITID